MSSPYVGLAAKVTLSGDFFTKDVGATMSHNARNMMEALGVEMERATKDIVAALPMPYSTGRQLRQAIGRAHANQGKRWTYWATVSANTYGMDKAHAISTKAAAVSMEKRFHPYRRVKGGVYRLRPILTANLTKGLD